jgi:hypothetical protein
MQSGCDQNQNDNSSFNSTSIVQYYPGLGVVHVLVRCSVRPFARAPLALLYTRYTALTRARE